MLLLKMAALVEAAIFPALPHESKMSITSFAAGETWCSSFLPIIGDTEVRHISDDQWHEESMQAES